MKQRACYVKLGSNPGNASLPNSHWTYRVERKAKGLSMPAKKLKLEKEIDEDDESLDALLEDYDFVYDQPIEL